MQDYFTLGRKGKLAGSYVVSKIRVYRGEGFWGVGSDEDYFALPAIKEIDKGAGNVP